MGKLFGGKGNKDGGGQEAPQPQAAPAPVAAASLPQAPQTFSSIDEYASTLPAPDYVDPAGKASANAEAA